MGRRGRKERREAKGKNYSPPSPPLAFSSIASAWAPVGISVATLFYVRVRVWERVRGRMAKSQRQTATSFSLPMPPDKSERVRDDRRSSFPFLSPRSHAHTHVYSHASPPTRGRPVAFGGYVRFLPPTSRQIVAQLIGRPTAARWNFKFFVSPRFPLSFSPLYPFFSPSPAFLSNEPIHIRIESSQRETESERKRERERGGGCANDSYFVAADVMTVPVANCRDPAALLIRMIYQASRNHPCATTLRQVMISTRVTTAELINPETEAGPRDLLPMKRRWSSLVVARWPEAFPPASSIRSTARLTDFRGRWPASNRHSRRHRSGNPRRRESHPTGERK